MVIIQHDYSSIKKPKMTNSFLLHLNHIKEIYDIDEGVIGLKFYHSFSDAEYRIELEGDSENLLAYALLELLVETSVDDQPENPPIIHGNVKLK